MSKYRFYTDEEDRVIISEISKCPHNLSKAFRNAAVKIDRSPGAVQNYWYTVLRKKTGTVFFLASGRQCTVNGKNVIVISDSSNTVRVLGNIWKKIKKLMKL